MKCPKCHADNKSEAKFCRKCGEKLSQVCPNCGAENLPDDNFCDQCGHNLILTSEPTPKPLSAEEKIEKIQKYLPKGIADKILAQRDRIEGEHKQVTVMFCDMEGFTPFADRFGPEETYSVMDQVYEILIHKVHDYEGTVNEMTGDGITQNHFNDLEKLKINRITIAKIEKWITDRQNEVMNILTLRKIIVTLGQIMAYAVRHRYISYNPVRDSERPKGQGKVEKKKIRVLTPAEINALLKAVANLKYKTLFRLAIFSGARQGELLGLKWSDIDWESSQVHIQRTFNNQEWYDVKTETSNRKIDLGPAMISELKKWKVACPPNKLNLIFPNEAGQPINHNNMVNRHFNPALESAEIEKTAFTI